MLDAEEARQRGWTDPTQRQMLRPRLLEAEDRPVVAVLRISPNQDVAQSPTDMVDLDRPVSHDDARIYDLPYSTGVEPAPAPGDGLP
ncbi:hypothetical protein IL992_22190 [Microbispora sp. NEAU-D428]|uniref:hypothetical protein n=1 Tax=Microbispora sitophila TaxID=2771537 RepID=UPI001866DBF7|nr:hypothetical protein [Microbispora sitophila]MBE3011888.1 hypothetical protein [Microbispora sitophila]